MTFSAVRILMRFYSYLYHALLALFLLGLSGLAMLSGGHTLHLDVLPWDGTALMWWLFGSALFGLMCIGLALAGRVRPLFFVWTLVVLVMMVRGYFFSTHTFHSGEVSTALYLVAGALLAVVGGWFQMVGQPARAQWEKARV